MSAIMDLLQTQQTFMIQFTCIATLNVVGALYYKHGPHAQCDWHDEEPNCTCAPHASTGSYACRMVRTFWGSEECLGVFKNALWCLAWVLITAAGHIMWIAIN